MYKVKNRLICSSAHLLILLLISSSLFSQSPQKMSYQAVVRNAGGALVVNQGVGIRISILQGSATGTLVYQETYSPNPQTNANGLVTLEIGGGTPTTGTFPTIDWSSGPYFLKSETDPAGGTNYTISGTSQLLSVPYALHAKTAASYTETDPVFIASSAHGITGTNITNWNTAYGWGNHASAGYVLNTRTITINGTALDLSANRSWNIGSVTSVGLSLPAIFSLSGSPVTTTGTLTATLASQTTNTVFASPNGSTGAPAFRALAASDIPNLDWSKITSGKPTTVAGYGINDAATKANIDALSVRIDETVTLTGDQTIAGKKTFSDTTIVPKLGIGISTPAPGVLLSLGTSAGRKMLIYDDGGGANDIGGGLGTDLGNHIAETSIFFGNYGGNGRLSIGAWTSSRTYNTKLTVLANGNVGIGTENPTSKLDVNGEINANNNKITNVALPVSDNDASNKVYVDSKTPIHFVGESYGGGIVFYIYDNGQHGLIAATADQSTGIRWSGGSYTNTRARGDGVGAGLKNTAIIIANQGSIDGNSFAATVCNEYSVTVGGVTYGDWYLPSKIELHFLYLQKNVVGGFVLLGYWSSTEIDATTSWIVSFATGNLFAEDKSGLSSYHVRAIRAF